MCTSKEGWSTAQDGFSLIELLVGLALTLCVACAALPVWLSLERTSVGEGDRLVVWMQGRVAVARLERDLRLASADGCPWAVAGPILEASPTQVVFLERAPDGYAPLLVEWEITGGALMRRWGACPVAPPATFRHSLYPDSKTMLGGIAIGAVFGYLVAGSAEQATVGSARLPFLDSVVLSMKAGGDGPGGATQVATIARVGR